MRSPKAREDRPSPLPERASGGVDTPALDAGLAGSPDALTAILAALETAAAHGVEHVHVEPADGHWRLRHRHDAGLEETLLDIDDALPRALSGLARALSALARDARAFTARVGRERRLVTLRTLDTTRGEAWLLTLHDSALAPPSLDALGLATTDLAVLRTRIGRLAGWLPIGSAGALDGARVVRAVAQELAAPTRSLICAESGPHPALARVLQLDADALAEPEATRDADAVLLAADPPPPVLLALATRAAGTLLVARAVRADRPSDVLRELLALGLAPAWIAHAVPLIVMRHRVRLLCPTCRLRAPDDDEPDRWLGTLRTSRVHDVAAWLEDSFATRCVPGSGCTACDGRAHAGVLDLTATVALDRETRAALADGDTDRAAARVDRPGALAARLAELVARGDVAAPEAERHLGPRY